MNNGDYALIGAKPPTSVCPDRYGFANSTLLDNRASQSAGNGPAPLNYAMSNGIGQVSYDNIYMRFNAQNRWRSGPEMSLHKGKVYTVQGFGSAPLAWEAVPVELPEDSMFMFGQNYASPACCSNGSTFSTSTGCVCTTPQQRDYVGLYRGDNNNYISNPPI